MLLGHVDRLTETAAKMLDAERDLDGLEFGRLGFRDGTARGVKIACLAPLVALR